MPPIAFAYASASAWPSPFGSCSTAISTGTPLPSLNCRRTRCPGPFGATIATVTSAGGLISPYRMLKPCPKKIASPSVRCGATDSV